MTPTQKSSANKGNYMLHWWGGCEAAVAEHLSITDNYLWFHLPEQRAAVRAKIEQFSNLGLAIIESDGPQTHFRTIANLVLRYQGKDYPLEHDFSYGYPEDSGAFMFTEGNYSCDCNRSIFLHEKYPEVPELDCGENIELISLTFSSIPKPRLF